MKKLIKILFVTRLLNNFAFFNLQIDLLSIVLLIAIMACVFYDIGIYTESNFLFNFQKLMIVYVVISFSIAFFCTILTEQIFYTNKIFQILLEASFYCMFFEKLIFILMLVFSLYYVLHKENGVVFKGKNFHELLFTYFLFTHFLMPYKIFLYCKDYGNIRALLLYIVFLVISSFDISVGFLFFSFLTYYFVIMWICVFYTNGFIHLYFKTGSNLGVLAVSFNVTNNREILLKNFGITFRPLLAFFLLISIGIQFEMYIGLYLFLSSLFFSVVENGKNDVYIKLDYNLNEKKIVEEIMQSSRERLRIAARSFASNIVSTVTTKAGQSGEDTTATKIRANLSSFDVQKNIELINKNKIGLRSGPVNKVIESYIDDTVNERLKTVDAKISIYYEDNSKVFNNGTKEQIDESQSKTTTLIVSAEGEKNHISGNGWVLAFSNFLQDQFNIPINHEVCLGMESRTVLGINGDKPSKGSGEPVVVVDVVYGACKVGQSTEGLILGENKNTLESTKVRNQLAARVIDLYKIFGPQIVIIGVREYLTVTSPPIDKLASHNTIVYSGKGGAKGKYFDFATVIPKIINQIEKQESNLPFQKNLMLLESYNELKGAEPSITKLNSPKLRTPSELKKSSRTSIDRDESHYNVIPQNVDCIVSKDRLELILNESLDDSKTFRDKYDGVMKQLRQIESVDARSKK